MAGFRPERHRHVFERLPHGPASRIHRDDDVVRRRAASQLGFEREVDFLRPQQRTGGGGDEEKRNGHARTTRRTGEHG
jgi:hypothetical protein